MGRHSVDQAPAAYRSATRDMLAYSDAARRIEDHLADPVATQEALAAIDKEAARHHIPIAAAAKLVTGEVLARPRGTPKADE